MKINRWPYGPRLPLHVFFLQRLILVRKKSQSVCKKRKKINQKINGPETVLDSVIFPSLFIITIQVKTRAVAMKKNEMTDNLFLDASIRRFVCRLVSWLVLY